MEVWARSQVPPQGMVGQLRVGNQSVSLTLYSPYSITHPPIHSFRPLLKTSPAPNPQSLAFASCLPELEFCQEIFINLS
jgi:hypothetical protein